VPSEIVLVVGATGLLGSRICRRLVSRGVTVRALVRPDAPGQTNLRASGVQLIGGDLTDHTSLARACIGVSAISSLLLRPLAAVISSLLMMAASPDDERVDMTPLATEFDVRLTPLAEYVRAQVTAQPARPSPALTTAG
jgi:NAD(P)-dependent dehydrogenase (short-subunit alcohol dehydrogenase family)